MSWVQKLVLSFVPAKTAARIEAESRSWMMRCPDGHERSIWEAGGIRYRASGNPRRLARCPVCGSKRWHKISRAS